MVIALARNYSEVGGKHFTVLSLWWCYWCCC